MSTVRFAVPVKPLGTNHAYAPARWGKRHGFRKTIEANTYAERIWWAARRIMGSRKPFTGSCLVRLWFVHPDNRSDIDGPIKLTLDALEGFVYANDRQVRRLEVDYLVDKEAPRVEFEIVEITP